MCAFDELAMLPYGGETKLYNKAIDKSKRAAFVKGANIILVETHNYATASGSVIFTERVTGSGYLSESKRADDDAAAKIVSGTNDDAKRELVIYREKYGDLRKTQSTIVNHIADAIEFNLLSVEGSKASQTVTIKFYVFTRRANQNFTLGGITTRSSATDDDGNQYGLKAITLGNSESDYSLYKELPTEVKLKGSLTFQSILPAVNKLSFITFEILSTNFDGGGNAVDGSVEVRNADIIWR